MGSDTLIYHAGALGDFVTVLPALAAWRSRRRTGRMALMGKPPTAALALDCGIVDEIMDESSAGLAFLAIGSRDERAAAFLERFGQVIVFAAASSPLVQTIAGSAPHLSMLRQDPFPSQRVNVTEYHLSLLDGVVGGDASVFLLRPSMSSVAAAATLCNDIGSLVVLHSGSGSRLKNWPIDRFIELARRAAADGLGVVWLQGPLERDSAYPESARVLEISSVPVAAALLSVARGCVGNDSGITHLSAAVGCPTVAIFGPSDPVVWGPTGRKVVTVYSETDCSPCHRHATVTCTRNRKCLLDSTVDRVYAALRGSIRQGTNTSEVTR